MASNNMRKVFFIVTISISVYGKMLMLGHQSCPAKISTHIFL